jgi:hypothetical protein
MILGGGTTFFSALFFFDFGPAADSDEALLPAFVTEFSGLSKIRVHTESFHRSS